MHWVRASTLQLHLFVGVPIGLEALEQTQWECSSLTEKQHLMRLRRVGDLTIPNTLRTLCQELTELMLGI